MQTRHERIALMNEAARRAAGLPARRVNTDARPRTEALDVWFTTANAGARRPCVILLHGFVQNRHAFSAGEHSWPTALVRAGFDVALVEMPGRDGHAPARDLLALVDDLSELVLLLAQRFGPLGFVGHSLGGLVGALLEPAARAHVAALVTVGTPVIPGPEALRRRGMELRAHPHALALHARGQAFPGPQWAQALRLARPGLELANLPLPLRLWAPGSLSSAALRDQLARSFAYDSYGVFADLLELSATDGRRAGAVDVHARLLRLTQPVLVVYGHDDDLAPPLGALPLFQLAPSPQKQLLAVDAGHIDLLVGTRAPRLVWDPVEAFLDRWLRAAN